MKNGENILQNFELTSKRRSDGQIVILTVKFTNVIETGDYANIQVFNLLLRNCLRHLNLKLIGRNFYDPDAKVKLLPNLFYILVFLIFMFLFRLI